MQPARDIDLHTLQSAVEDAYGLHIKQMTPSPVGEDAYGYFVDAGRSYYLKVYRRELNWQAVIGVPLALNRLGMWNAVAALPAQNDEFVRPFGNYRMALYPAIQGRTALEQPLTDEQLVEMGRILACLHTMRAQIDLPLHEETFHFPLREVYAQVLDSLPDALHHHDLYAREAARLLDDLKDRVAQELHDYDRAGRRACDEDAVMILCHHDPSVGNIIASEEDGRLYLIDWDGVLLAPKERDLGHFYGAQRPPVMQGYMELVGLVTLNEVILEYYRLEWNIQEIADYGGRLLFESDDHADAQKKHDLTELKQALKDAGML